MNHLRKLGFHRLLANTFEVAQFAEWSVMGSRDIDGQTRKGEHTGDCESMEPAGAVRHRHAKRGAARELGAVRVNQIAADLKR